MATILVVDDDQAVLTLLERLLRRRHHQVIQAESVAKALDVMTGGRKVDLVIMDIVMPKRNGVEGIVDFKQRFAGLPIIAISGGTRTISKGFSLGSARQTGADATLEKPFDSNALDRTIAQVLAS